MSNPLDRLRARYPDFDFWWSQPRDGPPMLYARTPAIRGYEWIHQAQQALPLTDAQIDAIGETLVATSVAEKYRVRT